MNLKKLVGKSLGPAIILSFFSSAAGATELLNVGNPCQYDFSKENTSPNKFGKNFDKDDFINFVFLRATVKIEESNSDRNLQKKCKFDTDKCEITAYISNRNDRNSDGNDFNTVSECLSEYLNNHVSEESFTIIETPNHDVVYSGTAQVNNSSVKKNNTPHTTNNEIAIPSGKDAGSDAAWDKYNKQSRQNDRTEDSTSDSAIKENYRQKNNF